MQQEPAQPLEFYKRRIGELEDSRDEVNARAGRRSQLLVLLGLIALAILYLSLAHGLLPVWTVLLLLPPAVILVRQMGRCRRESLKLMKLGEYYEGGIARLGRDWNALKDGAEFQDPNHLYAPDLDLFGHASLFQILCSARTQAGRVTLASWMKEPADREEILARRTAIAELRPRLDLREAIATAGTLYFSDCRPETFRTWEEDRATQPAFPRWLPVVAALVSLSLLAPPLLYLTGHLAWGGFWVNFGALLSAEGAFALVFQKRVRFILETVGPLSVEIPLVCDLLTMIETERFSSPKLVALADRLKADAASAGMRRLRRRIKLLQERENQWFAALAYLLLWGTQFCAAIDRWHRRQGTKMLEWLAVLGEFEALVSLSTYANEHPADVLPEIVEDGPVFEAKEIGHPLIDEAVCVRNDVRLGADLRFLIVSGSNMSGKSTFLRAIGLGAVMARMGAPVRCAQLRLSLLTVGTAIRISDSLAEGRSHFFAEMDRLRRLIDLAGEGPLLFLADEIMIGTNSHDRRIAAEWVVRALVERDAIGLVTTHDLALTEIASNGLPGANVYFEDSGERGELHFDYKLRPGVLSHSNALNIAHILGIDAAAGVSAPGGETPSPKNKD